MFEEVVSEELLSWFRLHRLVVLDPLPEASDLRSDFKQVQFCKSFVRSGAYAVINLGQVREPTCVALLAGWRA